MATEDPKLGGTEGSGMDTRTLEELAEQSGLVGSWGCSCGWGLRAMAFMPETVGERELADSSIVSPTGVASGIAALLLLLAVGCRGGRGT